MLEKEQIELMEQRIQKFNEFVMSQDIEKMPVGLLNGKMGLCIFYYVLGREMKDDNYTQFAEIILDNICKQIAYDCPTNFENGVAGIGWGIEFLSQNKFIESNTDEILEDIDMMILRYITSDNELDMSLSDGLAGYLYYIIQRLRDRDNPNFTLMYEVNKEMFIIIINKLEMCYNKFLVGISKDIWVDLFSGFSIHLYLLRQALDLNIYNNKIEKVLEQLMTVFKTSLPSLLTNRLYLVCGIEYAYPNLDTINYIKDSILYTINFDSLFCEIITSDIGIRRGLSGLKISLSNLLRKTPENFPHRTKLMQAYNQIIRKNVEFPEMNDAISCDFLSFADGLVGMILVDMLVGFSEKCSSEYVY